MTGRHFEVQGHTMLPRPVQSPHPPIWVGGNSKRAIRRAVDLADGWSPMPNPRALGARRRSAHLETVDELKALVAYADGYRVATGACRPVRGERDADGRRGSGFPGLRAARFLDHLSELESVGIAGVVLMFPERSRGELLDAIAEFGSEVIAR